MPVRVSLRTRWTAALLVTVLAPLAVFAVAGTRIQRDGLSDAERQLEVAICDHVGERVARTLFEATAVAHRVGQLLTEAGIADQDARLRLAEDALGRARELSSVTVYGPDGARWDAIARKDAPAVAPPPERLSAETMARVKDGEWLAPEFVAAGASKAAVLRYVEPVVRDGERRAWVVGTLGPALGEGLSDLAHARFGERDDGVLLIDGDGRIVAGPATGPLAVGATIAGRDILAHVDFARFDRAHDFGTTTEFTGEAGEPMVGTLRWLPSSRFAVAVRRPEGAVYASLAWSRRLLVGAGLGLAALALLVGAWLAARTTRPVASLVELTRAYARRDFAARADVKTGDELEQLGTSMARMADEIQAGEKEILRRAAVEADLSRFLPGEVARSIAAGERKLSLGGERRTVSVLFADVVSFTAFAERAGPETVVAFLNELFTVLAEVVFRHGGTVDKFIGDCVMAIFGAPGAQADHAARALACAEDMHRFVEASAPAWKARYGVDCRLGVGINAGEALVGNLGSESRMEYTAIGDVVNVAARLEGLARPGQTLVTAEVAAAVGDEFTLAPLGEHPLRGKQQAVSILELR